MEIHCAESEIKPRAETCWPRLLSSTVVFFLLEDGRGVFRWTYLQTCVSLPTKLTWTQHQQVPSEGPPPE